MKSHLITLGLAQEIETLKTEKEKLKNKLIEACAALGCDCRPGLLCNACEFRRDNPGLF